MKKTRPQLSPGARRTLALLGCFLLAVFAAKAFAVNPYLYIGKSEIPAASTDYLWAFFALFLWAVFYYTFCVLRLRPRWGEVLFGLLFGVMNFFGTSLFAYDSWAFIGVFLSVPQAVFKCLGQGLAMMAGLTLTAGRLAAHAQGARLLPASGPFCRFPRLLGLYRRHTVLFCMVLFSLCWLPYQIAFYPGAVIYDMCYMARDFFGLQPMSTWHSVFTTYVFGSCIWLGRLLGSDNHGTMIYMLLESLLQAYALACCVGYLRRLRAGKAWQMAALAFFGIVPIWGCYAMTIGKDTLYTATLLLFLLQTLALVREGEKAVARPLALVGYGLTALLTCLWRNNGLYVILPSAACVLLFLLRGRLRLKAMIPLASALALAVLFNNVLVPALGIIDNSSSGIYSLCFQQTARTVRDHPDSITPEEKAEIDRVLEYEQLPIVYEPWISDPVKETFRPFGQGKEVEQAALTRYRATWLSMFPKYWVTYLQAFMGNTASYYAFTPKYEGITYNQQAGLRFVVTHYWEDAPGALHATQPEALAPLRLGMTALVDRWWTLPLLSFFYVLPFYTWLLVAAGLSLVRQRRARDLVVMAPALLSFAVCLVGPVDDYMRYFLPIVAMTIPLLAFIAHPRQTET